MKIIDIQITPAQLPSYRPDDEWAKRTIGVQSAKLKLPMYQKIPKNKTKKINF